MPRLDETIRMLRTIRSGSTASFLSTPPHATLLKPFAFNGSNPGGLKAWSHAPDGGRKMPLVVVLHGCTQSAVEYDAGSGWSALAEEHGFAVLAPEQQRANNPNLCFNWFSADDVRRGAGEVLSIREMVAGMIERHGIDPSRVYVTGLSAGGAMATALLATYPDVFAGGAIMAGLPFGAADTMPKAFERMRGHGHADAARYAAQVRAASDHEGPWPTVSVWHGTSDSTVVPANADAIVGQWLALHGLPLEATERSVVDGAVHRVWRDTAGRVRLEDYRVPGMAHGTALATTGPDAIGTPMPYMLDVGISSTRRTAARWGMLDPSKVMAAPASASVVEVEDAYARRSADRRKKQSGVQDTIEAALRSAGLMR